MSFRADVGFMYVNPYYSGMYLSLHSLPARTAVSVHYNDKL